jgi:hypothetical protein
MQVTRSIGTAYTPASHSAANIAADVRSHLASLGIDPCRKGALFAATTDTPDTMRNAVADLGLIWKPCDAHLLNLVLKFPFTHPNAPDAVAPAASLLARMRSLINRFNGSPNILHQFKSCLALHKSDVEAALLLHEPNRTSKKRALPRKLKTYPETRFNYIYMSVRRMLVFWVPLQQCLLLPAVAAAISPSERVTVDDYTLLNDIHTLLCEFQTVMVDMQASSHPTLSTSFVSILTLHITLRDPIVHTVNGVVAEDPTTTALRECLRDQVFRRFLHADWCVDGLCC